MAKANGQDNLALCRKGLSVQAEVHFHGDHDRDGDFTVLHRRLETVFTHRLDSLFVQPHAERPDDVDILRHSLRIDDERYLANSLILGAPRLVGELGLDVIQGNRGRDAAAYAIDAAAGVAAAAGTEAVAIAGAQAATRAGAHAAA